MTTPPPPAGGRGGSLVAKLGGNRNAALLAAAVTVAGVALVSRNRSKSQATTLMTSGEFDSSPYDMWNAWQSEYEDLQQQINGTQGETSAGGPVKPPKVPLPAPIPKPWPPKPAPKPVPPKPKPKPKSHIVQVRKGDTLSRIAAKNHDTLAKLKKLNPGLFNKAHRGGNLIHPGEKVKV